MLVLDGERSPTSSWTRPTCGAGSAPRLQHRRAMSPTDAPVPLNGDVTVSAVAGRGRASGTCRWRRPQDGQGDDQLHELSDYTHQLGATSAGSASSASGASATTSTRSCQIRASCAPPASNIALFGAIGPGDRLLDIFADHGFRVVAIFDTDPGKVGTKVGAQTVRHIDDLKQMVEDEDIVVGVLAVPTAAAGLADDLVAAGVKIIFNYSEALLQVPPEVTVHSAPPSTSSTRCTSTSPRLPAARSPPCPPSTSTPPKRLHHDPPTSPSGSRKEFAILDPPLDMVPR